MRLWPPRRALPVAAAVGCLAALRLTATSHARGSADPSTATRTDGGVVLHVEVDGRPDADLTVLFVHGYGASLGEWRHQRAALAPHARLVLFDQRGHGRSSWANARRSTVGQLGQDLRAVLRDHADGRPVVVVGHSLGGMAALALADEHPHLVGSTITGVGLLSTSAGRLPRIALPTAAARLLRRTHAAAPLLWSLWLVAPLIDRLSPLRTPFVRAFVRRRLFSGRDADPADVESAVDDVAATPLSVLLALAPAMLHYGRAEAVDRLRPVPVLLLAGTRDAAIPVSHSLRLAQRVNGCGDLVLIEGAGHMVNLTDADAVSAALLRLLDAAAGTPVTGPSGSGRRQREGA